MLKQDYKGKIYHLIFNNSSTEQKLAEGLDTENIKFILVNQDKYSKTGEPYSEINQIFEDAISFVPADAEVITFTDDDDLYLENHISEGAKGYTQALNLNKLSYKPYYSWMDINEGREKVNNMCEPSIFVFKDFIQRIGFEKHSAAYHHKWINELKDNDLWYEPLEGIPTFIYQWVGGVFHISGDGDNPDNLKNLRNFEQDEGDQIITPWDIVER